MPASPWSTSTIIIILIITATTTAAATRWPNKSRRSVTWRKMSSTSSEPLGSKLDSVCHSDHTAEGHALLVPTSRQYSAREGCTPSSDGTLVPASRLCIASASNLCLPNSARGLSLLPFPDKEALAHPVKPRAGSNRSDHFPNSREAKLNVTQSHEPASHLASTSLNQRSSLSHAGFSLGSTESRAPPSVKTQPTVSVKEAEACHGRPRRA